MSSASGPQQSSSLPIVIAGGGVAALEAILALRAAGGDDVPIELICPDRLFTYRPLSVLEPFSEIEPRTVDLTEFATEQRIVLRQGQVTRINPADHLVGTDAGEEVAYRALLIATGAEAMPALDGAMIFGGHDDTFALRGVLDHIEWREATALVFVIPDRSQWVLPLYELALLSRARLDDHGTPDATVTVLTAEKDPIEIVGEQASDTLLMLLARSGVRLMTEVEVRSAEDRAVLLGDGSRLAADHIFTLPRWRGTPMDGLPVDDDGFVPIDSCCRARGIPDVYAAGDITAGFPKQGGLAAAQADAAASAILADMGRPVEAVPFDLALRGVLLTGDVLDALRGHLPDDHELPWLPPTKIVARHLGTYLGTRDPESRDAATWQREGRIPGEIEIGTEG